MIAQVAGSIPIGPRRDPEITVPLRIITRANFWANNPSAEITVPLRIIIRAKLQIPTEISVPLRTIIWAKILQQKKEKKGFIIELMVIQSLSKIKFSSFKIPNISSLQLINIL